MINGEISRSNALSSTGHPSLYIHTSKSRDFPSSLSPVATKTRLERELAEAVRDEGDNGPDNPSGSGEGEDVGSDSDSDYGGPMGGGGGGVGGGAYHNESLEASMWSLDVSATSSLETSACETEVSLYSGIHFKGNQRTYQMPRVQNSQLPPSPPPLRHHIPQFPNLTSFLLFRASRSTQLANYFYWFLSVECSEDKDIHAMTKYERIRLKFLEDLKNVSVCSGVTLVCTI